MVFGGRWFFVLNPAQTADPDFFGDMMMTKFEFFIGSGRRFFCVPGQEAQHTTLLTLVRARSALSWLTVSAP